MKSIHRFVVLALVIALTFPSMSWAHDHCPPPPKENCKAPGPKPKKPDSSDCDSLAARKEQLQKDIADMELMQENIGLELALRAGRDVSEAEQFLAEMLLLAFSIPGSGIKTGVDAAKWLGEQAVGTVLGEMGVELPSPDSVTADPNFEGQSTEALSQLAAAITAALAVRYGELNALETAIADCWRLYDIDFAQYEKADATWEQDTYEYEQCMKKHKRDLRRWNRDCEE